MSANSANALKAWLEGQGLGLPFFRDRAPDNQTLFADDLRPTPYGTITESISITSEPAFNAFDDSYGHVREVVQVDVIQPWRDLTKDPPVVVESYTLADAVTRALDGKRPTTAPTWVGGMTVDGVLRRVDVGGNYVQTSITVSIRRDLTPVGTVPPGEVLPAPAPPVDAYGGY